MGKRIPLDPTAELRPDVERFLTGYRPRMVAADRWDIYGDFVVETVTAARPPSVPAARSLVASLIPLTDYTERIGQPVDRKDVLDPDHISSFLEAARSPRAARLAIRPFSDEMLKRIHSDCERMGIALNPRAPWDMPRPAFHRSRVKPPYSPTEAKNFIRVARTSTSPHHLAVVVLGFGAGLTGHWQPRITKDDVELRGNTYWVHADNPDRWIPVLARYTDDMAKVLVSAPADGPLIGGEAINRQRASRVTSRISARAGQRLVPARMRTTWFVRHINHQTDLRYLLEMAGLESLTTIWELLPHARPVNTDVAARKAARA
jgi:hypothetical protein